MLIQRKPSWLLLNGKNTAFSCIIHQCCHGQLMNSHLKLDMPGPQFQGYILSHIRKHMVKLIRDQFGNNSSAVQTMVSIKHITFREELLTAGNDMQPTKESSSSWAPRSIILTESFKCPCEELSRICWCHWIVVRRTCIRLTLEYDYFYYVCVTIFDI